VEGWLASAATRDKLQLELATHRDMLVSELLSVSLLARRVTPPGVELSPGGSLAVAGVREPVAASLAALL
jgi:hypothetical protein